MIGCDIKYRIEESFGDHVPITVSIHTDCLSTEIEVLRKIDNFIRGNWSGSILQFECLEVDDGQQ